MKRHYHVICGNHNCLPDTNIYAENLQSAKVSLRELVQVLKENGDKFFGSISKCWFEDKNRNYYVGISPCDQGCKPDDMDY